MIPPGVSSQRDVHALSLFQRAFFVQKHGRRQVGIHSRFRAQCRQVPYIAIRICRQCPEDLLHGKAISDQCQRQLEGVRVDRLPDAEHCAGTGLPESLHGRPGLFPVRLIVKADAQRRSERVVLRGNPVNLIEPHKLNGRDAQLFLQISRGRPRLRVQDQVEIRLRHLLKLSKVRTGRYFPYLSDANLPEQDPELAPFVDRGKISHKVNAVRLLLHRFQKRIDGLPNMDHGRLAAFSCERVHIAGAHADIAVLCRDS